MTESENTAAKKGDLDVGIVEASAPAKLIEMKLFTDSLDHILAELERIDLLIRLQVCRARELYSGDVEFQGLCISERDVDDLLAKPCGLPCWARRASAPKEATAWADLAQLKVAIRQRKLATLSKGVRLRLEEAVQLFHLTDLDLDILLVCLAPEMDLGYEKLYAYLQDDVTQKRPSVDLVLNLLCPTLEEKLEARKRFAIGSPLIDHDLIQLVGDPSQAEQLLLRNYCKLACRIVAFLLGMDSIDDRLSTSTNSKKPETRLAEMLLPNALGNRLLEVATKKRLDGQRMLVYLRGSPGSGRQSLAAALCCELTGSDLLVVQTKQLLETPEPGFRAGVRIVVREALLQRAALYWHGFKVLLVEDKASELDYLLRELQKGPFLCLFGGETLWKPPAGQIGVDGLVHVELPPLNREDRLILWERFLRQEDRAADVDLATLSERFRLSAGGIKSAATSALAAMRWGNGGESRVSMDDLFIACRAQSNYRLTAVAKKVDPKYGWEDIVLPPDQMAQLRDILDQAQYRHIVFGKWGFDRKLSIGKGLSALFSGPPGTGKTMAAEVIARELHLDLYRIDLSQIVSKYIGETEKNLDQVFREAHGSNSILFFDEADALFGKRSEVKDAHDRYANIEVGYLLQKMEEYEGIAILATNLRQNIDEGFVRRMQVIIEFPFPDEEYRRRIWQVAFPREAPLSEEVDFGFLAREIRMAGGNIKNIALTAAFYAASDGKTIRMPHLLQAARREHQKVGRTWTENMSP